MPWDVKQDDRCSTAKPWAVVKQDDNSIEGCHTSEDDAKKQQAALYASEKRSMPELLEDEDVVRPPRDNLVRFVAGESVRAVVDEEHGDGRLATLVGKLVTFNDWAEVNSAVEGHYLERAAPGAFTKTFAENLARMRVIFDHGMDRAIGRKPLGPIEKILDDGQSVSYEAALLDTSYNRDLLPGLRAGLYGSSWRMNAIKPEFKGRPPRSDYNPEGLPEVTIREARILELGPTPFPVYHGTSAGVRSMTDEYLASLINRDGSQTALPTGPEVIPQSTEASRATPVTYPSISLTDFVERLTNGT
jgi:phage head maturation protease